MSPSLLYSAACVVLFHGTAVAISVSGLVTMKDGSSPAGIQIRVEQVGGELPIFSALTSANGTWSISDPLLFGNIRVTAEKPGYQLTPTGIDRFTSSNISDANFVATPLVPDLSVLDAHGSVLTADAVVSIGSDFPGSERAFILTLRNDGISPLQTLSTTLSGPQAAEFAIVTQPPATLAPGQSIALQIAWKPVASGPRSATLTVLSNDPDEGSFPVTLNGEALSLDRITVSTTADSGPGSLRSAMAEAAVISGPHVVRFDPALDGRIITLSSQIGVDDADDITVDASNLPSGLEIRASNGSRHFRVMAGASLALDNLTLTDGRGSGEDRGGSIRNDGTLRLRRCQLRSNVQTGNLDSAGGAISNAGQLTLIECELSHNTAKVGGAIHNEGSATFTDCSFFSNGALIFTISGGAIVSNGPLQLNRCLLNGNTVNTSGAGLFLAGPTTLTSCTLSENRCFSSTGRGAGILNTTGRLQLDHCTITLNVGNGIHQEGSGGTTHLRNSIVAGNISSTGTFEANFGGIENKIFMESPNLIRFPPQGAIGENPIATDPLLSPLGNFGGKSLTHALLPGSPARNAATGSMATTDQRGFPIVGVPDLGAYEAGNIASNFSAYIWETLPTTATPAQHAADTDFDGDGQNNLEEWLALTDASSANSFFFIAIDSKDGSLGIHFQSSIGRRYVLEISTALDPILFSPVLGQPILLGDGNPLRFTADPSPVKQFFRVQAIP